MIDSAGCGSQVPPADSTAARASLRIFCGSVSVSSSINWSTGAG